MSRDYGRFGQSHPFAQGVVRLHIENHPEEIADVAPDVIATMNARLRGESASDLYEPDSQRTTEVQLDRQISVVQRVVSSPKDVFRAFQSPRLAAELRSDLLSEGLDREFLHQYSLRKSGGNFVDEADVYAFLLGQEQLTTKRERLRATLRLISVPQAIVDLYLATHFTPFAITREVIQLDHRLSNMMGQRRLMDELSRILAAAYGETK